MRTFSLPLLILLALLGVATVACSTVPPLPPKAAELNQTGAEALAYYNTLKERFKAQILVPKPADTTADAAPR